MDKISVIVPIYKVEKYINECIDSLIAETVDFELILVDDGSPDNCGSICDNYADKDSRIKVIHKTNGGLISAWKAGVNAASGNYLMFVDGDDWVETNLISEAMKIIEKTDDDVDLIQFEFYNKNVVLNLEYRQVDVKDLYPNMMYYRGYSKIVVNSRCAKIFKTDIMLKILDDINNVIQIGEDKLTTFTYLLNSRKVAFYNYQCYHYRMNYDSMTNKYSEKLYEKTDILFNCLKNNIQKHRVDFDFSDQICMEKAMYATAILANEYKLGDTKKLKRMFEKLLKDADVAKGVEIIDTNYLNYFCRNAVKALRNKDFFKLQVLLFMKKVQNNAIRVLKLRKTR